MLLRAIIIDDEFMGVSTLKTLIEEYIKEVRVVAETTKAGEAIRLIQDYKPEIVFLDINMPEMTGFELLEKLSWKNFSLVFTTAYREYALKALKNNALDYILKPIDYLDVQAAVNKVQLNLKSQVTNNSSLNYSKLVNELNYSPKNKILVSLKSGIEALDISEIIYLESQSNYTKIFLTGMQVLLTSKTLKEFEEQLCIAGLNFMRVHHSFIINLNKVTKYLKSEDQVVLNDQQKIPLSKSKREGFYSWLKFKA